MSMNSNNGIPERIQAELLGIICIFEERIENLKQELAGYSEFDARTAFCCIDIDEKGYIDVEDIRALVNRLPADYHGLSGVPSQRFGWFLRKYGSRNKMSYEQFLLLLLPKKSPSLAQSLMVRNPIYNTLPEYLLKRFQELIGYYLILILETQERKEILYRHFRLNVRDIYQRLHETIQDQQGLHAFINRNGYEIKREKVQYLVNHVSNKVLLKDFHQSQYRQVFSPVDSFSLAPLDPPPNQTRRDHSPDPRFRTLRERSPLSKRSFADSFYEKSKDNYLTIKYETNRGNFTNRTYGSNENMQANLPAIREIGSMESIRSHQKERLNYSPIFRESAKQFESIDLPGVIDNMISQKNVSIGASNRYIPQIPTRSYEPLIGFTSNQTIPQPQVIPQPQTSTFLIDKFLKQPSQAPSSSYISPKKNYKPTKQIFQDDLEESMNNAIKYY